MTDKEREARNNALRLAYALERNADPATVAKLAQLLNYDRAQLTKDIAALAGYVTEYRQAQEEA